MSLKVFPLLLSFGRIWEELVSTPLYMFGRIHQWSQLVPDFCLFGGFYLLMVAEMVKNPLAMWETLVQCLVWEGPPGGGQPTPVFWPGEFQGQRSLAGCSPWGRRVRHDWMTFTFTSIFLLVSSLFRFPDSSWFSLDRLNISRNLSISFRLSSLLVYDFSQWSVMIFYISIVSVATSQFSFLILLICMFFILFRSESSYRFFKFFKKNTFNPIEFFSVHFLVTISALIFPSFYQPLCFICSSFCHSKRCVKLRSLPLRLKFWYKQIASFTENLGTFSQSSVLGPGMGESPWTF